MRFRIPDTFTICGVIHTTTRPEHLVGNEGLKGSFCGFTRTIQIERTLTTDEAWRTFLHEALHAANDLYRAGLVDNNIERLANGIAELLAQLEPEP